MEAELEKILELVEVYARPIEEANRWLYQDIAHGLSYEVMGSGIQDQELDMVFQQIFDGLRNNDSLTLGQLRERTGKGSAEYFLIDSIIKYQFAQSSYVHE